MWFFKKKPLDQIETVFCDHISARARCMFADAGYEFASTPGEAGLIWLRTKFRQYFDTLTEGQLINHLPNQRELVEKGDLTKNIQSYYSAHPEAAKEVEPFHPESYRLYVDAEKKQFFSQLSHRQGPDNIWILKPVNLSMGKGIEIFSDPVKLWKRFRTVESSREEKFVIQRYISNPLLLDGKKSEIRMYWLIASLDPLMVLLYPEGTVRLNTLPYTLDQLDNPLIHITNAYQQKSHPEYDPDAVLKWTFSALGKFLADKRGEADAAFVGKRLVETVKGHLRVVSHGAYANLVAGLKPGGYFGLYGVDMIVDDALKVWLTEIQKGPGLSYSDPVKKRLIPPMFTEAMQIMFEVRRRKLRGESLAHLDAMKRFEWVINGAVSPPASEE